MKSLRKVRSRCKVTCHTWLCCYAESGIRLSVSPESSSSCPLATSRTRSSRLVSAPARGCSSSKARSTSHPLSQFLAATIPIPFAPWRPRQQAADQTSAQSAQKTFSAAFPGSAPHKPPAGASDPPTSPSEKLGRFALAAPRSWARSDNAPAHHGQPKSRSDPARTPTSETPRRQILQLVFPTGTQQKSFLPESAPRKVCLQPAKANRGRTLFESSAGSALLHCVVCPCTIHAISPHP